MIEALSPIYIGSFSDYRSVLVLADDPRPAQAGPVFCQPEQLRDKLQQFKPQYSQQDQRALASIWSKYYFLRLIPPVVAASLVLNRHLPLKLDNIAIVFDEESLPCAFKLPHDGHEYTEPPPSPEQRFAHLIDDNLMPFIEALGQATGISAKVLWSNAGNYFEWILTQMSALQLPDEMLSPGYQLLNSRFLQSDTSKKQRNPLWQPIRYVEHNGQQNHRQRRLCCIRYRLPDMPLCENCPRANVILSRIKQ